MGTWFLGRLQTERDKARVLEGLEGASAQAGSTFNKGEMEATLAGLGSRVFLMNNVHDNQPKVFHTRWAMSYLRGPLTRDHIKGLMADKKAELEKQAKANPKTSEASSSSPAAKMQTARPVISAKIPQMFWPLSGRLPEGSKLQYRPGLFGKAKLHFVKSTLKVDTWRDCYAMQPVHDELPTPVWDSALLFENTPPMDRDPQLGAEFVDLESALAQEKNYRGWDDDLEDYLYRTEKFVVWKCKELKEFSEPGEVEADFRIRMTQTAREQRDDKKDVVRKKYDKRIDRANAAVRKAEAYVSEQKSQFWMKILSMVGGFISMFAGGSRRRSSGMSGAMRERGQQTRAEQRLEDKRIDLEELEDELEEKITEIEIDFEPSNLKLEKTEVPLRKSDTNVDPISLVWLPWRVDANGATQPAY